LQDVLAMPVGHTEKGIPKPSDVCGAFWSMAMAVKLLK